MGGNLFHNTKRHSTSDMLEKCHKVQYDLITLDIESRTIQSLYNKADHGDLDLIAVKDDIMLDNLFKLTQLYPEYAINGKHVNLSLIPNDMLPNILSSADVISFNCSGLQVDLILIERESVDFAVNYHSYNDLGGIIGCITKQLGYTLGREGLFIDDLPINSYGKYKVYLTKGFQHFCNVFELDSSIYYGDRLLNDVDDMYEYLKDWKYFNSHWMNPSLMNSTRRNRASKRTVFNQITDLAKRDGNIVNWDTPVPELIQYFDHRWIEYQKQENYMLANLKRERKKAMSLERVVRVLGYEPKNIGQLFIAISDMFGGNAEAKDYLYRIDDDQFKLLLNDIIDNLR